MDKENSNYSREKTTKKEERKDGPATQMRYGVEYLAAGTKLWHRWDIICDELELGAFVSALHEWQKQPYLGGMSGKGFGLVGSRYGIGNGRRTRNNLHRLDRNLSS
ncbi:hypothetical protein BF29_2596 [Heyndrickxia coagulans DSM 1 = ATCC 7050]|uniref:hypothetical protein n=1 Tax=Heyndrickxia coagulans TaxID=1398 RepID=UPI0005A364CC|nr:hypothetical protein [Heyndrickxia coagulans]AJH77785.1 hypothetical protein BF29_2596 [Heyndrickxia coagulans DSM 1 = ATCC 7050]UYM81177.1 hypothetical protein OF848_12585 [Heyndrickxia coagulans]